MDVQDLRSDCSFITVIDGTREGYPLGCTAVYCSALQSGSDEWLSPGDTAAGIQSARAPKYEGKLGVFGARAF